MARLGQIALLVALALAAFGTVGIRVENGIARVRHRRWILLVKRFATPEMPMSMSFVIT